MSSMSPADHGHFFLGEGHEKNERRTWAVIVLCTVMMAAEIVGGLIFGSIALVADGLHMSTHAGALLLAAKSDLGDAVFGRGVDNGQSFAGLGIAPLTIDIHLPVGTGGRGLNRCGGHAALLLFGDKG